MRIKSPLINREILEEAEKFFWDNKRAISDYAERTDLTFEAGNKWSIDIQSGRCTYDPMFFFRNGFSYAESMWAVCHEIEHIRDLRKDPKAYADLYRRTGRGRRRLELLYNRINDIYINKELDRRFPAHLETRQSLYKYRIIRMTDHTARPRHLQFIYAILCKKMLPDEDVVVSDEVRSEIEKLKNIDGEGTDFTELLSDSTASPGDRFDLIRDYIEPVYERFYHEDLEESLKQKKNKARENVPQGDFFEGSPDGIKAEDYFSSEYDEADEGLPEALSREQIRNAVDQEILLERERNKTPEQIAREQFKALHGVSPEEVESFADHYKKIAHYIDPLSRIFERIIETRKNTRRRLKERTDNGVIIDPSLLPQAYIDAYGGVAESRTQLKIRKDELDQHKPLDFEFTLICDLSASMNENYPGGKSYEQRLCAILIVEALAEFARKLNAERIERIVDLRIFTEIRGFGAEDEILKPMSDAIDYYTRVKIFRRLELCVGKRTADYKSLEIVLLKTGEDVTRRIREMNLKKAVVLITDGGSNNPGLARNIKERLTGRGVVVKAIQIGEATIKDTESFNYAWGSDGLPCRDVSRLVSIIEKLLEDLLEDL
ncbi:MAG: VWA domain-containing protein [Spirochaetes bacterium]|nr:VWA domain-containing protein [Spirochaetota bacterium]